MSAPRRRPAQPGPRHPARRVGRGSARSAAARSEFALTSRCSPGCRSTRSADWLDLAVPVVDPPRRRAGAGRDGPPVLPDGWLRVVPGDPDTAGVPGRVRPHAVELGVRGPGRDGGAGRGHPARRGWRTAEPGRLSGSGTTAGWSRWPASACARAAGGGESRSARCTDPEPSRQGPGPAAGGGGRRRIVARGERLVLMCRRLTRTLSASTGRWGSRSRGRCGSTCCARRGRREFEVDSAAPDGRGGEHLSRISGSRT
ncbi:hypothetical protein HBB16_13770 [Pseudonocardia sp. MCCB 268]|nr:hypothetical protein [Pseudonocardia cytotoxica]